VPRLTLEGCSKSPTNGSENRHSCLQRAEDYFNGEYDLNGR
jgi:hypothetical protein